MSFIDLFIYMQPDGHLCSTISPPAGASAKTFMLFSHLLYMETIFLPRQARDKYGESTQKKLPFFLRCEIMLDRCIGTCTLEWHKTTHCPGPFAVSRLSRLAMRPTVFHDRLRTDSTEKKLKGNNPNMAVCFRCNVHMPVYIR
jgi:hypothetical protein